jgi:hypothetical protein
MTDVPGHGSPENPFAGQGAVLLDIGGDIGAVVVDMPSEMVGVEVEVRPAAPGQGRDEDGAPGGPQRHAHHPHVAVVVRPLPSGSAPSLVFGEVPQGTYELCEKGSSQVRLTATVTGGEVTELVWPR